jgi:hypothetical protein
MRARLTLMLLLIPACGKSDEQKAAEAVAAQVEAATKQMAEAMKDGGAAAAGGVAAGVALGATQAKEAVDFRELKSLLPEELPGMKRSNSDGERTSAMGFTISKAEAQYEGENGANVSITVTDVGAMAGVAAMATYAWAAGTIDRESETSYERSTTIKGYRGYERYDRQSNSGEVQVLVAGRFVVEVNGNNMPMDAIKAALDKVDLGKLESMKNVGVN